MCLPGLIDQETTSAVRASLVQQLYCKCKSKHSLNPDADGDAELGSDAAQAQQQCTASDVDGPGATVVKYHAGWCLMAARRELELSPTAISSLLSLLPAFGNDVASSLKPCLENVTAVQSIAAQRNDPQPPNVMLDHAYSATEKETTHDANKHLFVPSDLAMPFFIGLHTATQACFKDALKNHKRDAVKAMTATLLKDEQVQKAFSAIVPLENGGDKLLELIVQYFMKSKQKQLIGEHRLSPAKSSVALRSSLRQQSQRPSGRDLHSEQTTGRVKSLLVSGKVDEGIALLATLPDADCKVTLSKLTVSLLKTCLQHYKEPVGSSVKAVKVSRLLALLRKEVSVFACIIWVNSRSIIVQHEQGV